jgi:RNA polymerase sigma-70 factor, ECF subfamily
VDENQRLAERFEEHRDHLRSVAYRMLGSWAEADDAVQDAWLRLSRADAGEIQNLGGWLTTVTARVCLNVLRARRSRREDATEVVRLPDPQVSPPDEEAVRADAVGLALMVVLDSMVPAERLAFVLHDMFGVPFEEIAPIVERTPAATRQLASRGRRRVRSADLPTPERDLARQRRAVDAFFRAARGGEFDTLVALLDPDVVLRADAGAWRPALSVVVRGAEEVAGQAVRFAMPHAELRPVLVSGSAGVVVTVRGRPFSIMGFTVSGDRIVAIDTLADPERVATCLATATGG